jgi:hypothetical protein
MNSTGRRRLCRFFLAAALLLICQPAWAVKRVALVVGNSTYKNAPQLSNPVNDAATLAAALKSAGFDVVDTRLDLQAADMRRALRDFADQARDADIAVVYYAGHGIEIDGTNYLIPTDATLERDTDVYDEAFSLDRVLLAVEPARQLRLVIVDACRNNPFAETMKRTVGSRAVTRGLARIEPATSNTLVAFAAKAGSTASDGNSKNSPYAAALVKYIATPGLDLRRVFGFVRDEVMKATGNRQEPYVYGSLGGDDVPLVPAKDAASSTSPQTDMRRDYELAVQIGNKDALTAFLAQYPDGFYASLARIQLARIAAEKTGAASPEQSPPATQEQARTAAEKLAEEQIAEAERKRAATEQGADHAPGSDNAAGSKVANSLSAPEKVPGTNIAGPSLVPPQAELIKSVQTELRRVGCLSTAADGEWNAASQRSLALFNKNAGTKFDVKLANLDALDAIKLKPSRVCPLICQPGFKADGDHCSKIVCAEGSILDDDNKCVKRRPKTPTANREPGERPDRATHDRPRPASPQASGQIVCDDHLCRPVQRGCHLEYRTSEQGGSRMGGGSNVQICN